MKKSKLTTDVVDFGKKKSNPRGLDKVIRITPHHMAGNMGAKECARYHLTTKERNASANYYINGKDIVCGVSEDRRAWTSGSPSNDYSAITIEVANSTKGPDWKISDASYKSLVALCADICERYGIDPHYDGTKKGTITMHKMFATTTCPGPYLSKLITSGQFEKDIIAKMHGASNDVKPEPAKPKDPVSKSFLVKVTAKKLNIRSGPGTNYNKAGTIKKDDVYTIVEIKSGAGSESGWGKLKSGAGWISLDYTKKVNG